MAGMNGTRIQVGAMMVSTGANGPGRRLVLWMQGCPFRCRGCFNPEFHSLRGGRPMSVAGVIDAAADAGGIEGLTFSGGEPFLQADALARLAEEARSLGLGIVCYTGYCIEDIHAGRVRHGMELLSRVDMLIDGLFVEEEQAPLAWRGSRNQRLHLLTGRYMQAAQDAEARPHHETEVIIGPESLAVTGIFPMEFILRLRHRLGGVDRRGKGAERHGGMAGESEAGA